MWKDFFFFSASQRIGIVILVFLIICISVLNFLIPHFAEERIVLQDSIANAEFERFKQSLVSLDSLNDRKYKFKNKEWDRGAREKNISNVKLGYRLFPFDPNNIDSADFVSLGLKPYIASNILKYRRKGGRFASKEAFSKVYGISEGKYAELEPFIQITAIDKVDSKDSLTTKPSAKKADLIVELNSADTATLMQVKGIGRGYAKSIIRFRQQVGGFVDVNQLREIYGMTDENYNKIKPFCTVNPALVKKLNINTASVERLKSHPYLNFYQAKQIYELRRKLGKLTGMNDLKNLSELDENTLRKIEPYLVFE
ncbi:helix-hairpin-helix domain-containing protein [Paludibacter sp.]